MDKDTSGFAGWKEVKFFEGKGPHGEMTGRDGFRNIVTGEECKPEKGWDGEPPCPTGDLAIVRHNSALYRENFEKIDWNGGRV